MFITYCSLINIFVDLTTGNNKGKETQMKFERKNEKKNNNVGIE